MEMGEHRRKLYDSRKRVPMPTSETGKAIASRNATTHGLFARDVVLPSLGEDPAGYQQLQAEWTKQLTPRNLLEQHYVEKIAAASWRLRRLHRWQAQLFEDDTLTETDRLDRLSAVLRHETALHRQIDTAVKLLGKDVPQLYQRRLRDQVLEDLHISERECRDEPETDTIISLETSNRLYQLRKATTQAANELSEAPLDTDTSEICRNEPLFLLPAPLSHSALQVASADKGGAGDGGCLKFAKTNLPLSRSAPTERCCGSRKPAYQAARTTSAPA